jgi:iduronate 2-sulfatase
MIRCLSFCICLGLAFPNSASSAGKRPNVLFIAVDDLRPELGCYGQPVHSPNIDRLAMTGTRFDRAYVQVALCMPSRVSMLTGQRPETTGVVDFSVRFRDVQPNVLTLPQHFRNNGYTAVAFGKIFHNDDKASWSEPLFKSRRSEDDYHTDFGRKVLAWTREDHRRLTYVWDLGDGITKTKRPGGLPWEAPDVPDNAVRDGQLADAAVAKLKELNAGERPFFLAVGFHKPHLPFIAPKKYFDLYDPQAIVPASQPNPPKDAPKFATYNWNDLRHYYGIPDVGPVSAQQARELKHAYYACVSFVDAQVGKVLAEIDQGNTIVVLWGDHGWQLGEHGMWDKHSNYETSTRIPLIVRVPGQRPASTDALVEAVDLYPTLADLCGLDLPEHLEGTSFVPLISDPDRAWKTAAFSQYRRVIPGYGKISRGMGYAIRTDRFRFVEWLVPGTDFRAYELYDHLTDPDENVNVASQPQFRQQFEQLKHKLHAGWRAARPAA